MSVRFAEDYTASLIQHVELGDEASLERAHQLGRRALTDGLGVLNVVAQHEYAVHAAARRQSTDIEKVRDAALPFLLQSLAALDMATRGFVEAAERVAVERAHVNQLRTLADSFVSAHVEHLADQRLRGLVDSARRVVDAAGAYVHFGGLRVWHGVPPAVAEVIGTRLLTDNAADTSQGRFADAAPLAEHWLAARLDADDGTNGRPGGAVVACRETEFTAFDGAVLAQFAKLASASLRNALLYEREHDIAATLQSSLLPEAPLSTGGLMISARYQPTGAASGVGGDWFDVIGLPGRRVGLVMGDVMGHGLTAAALMVQLSVAVHAYAVDEPSPSALLNRLEHLVASRSDERLATLVYAIVHEGGVLRFANAGHPPPLVVTAEGTTRYLPEALSVPIGVNSDRIAHHEDTAILPPGATLLLYTDGLVERRGRPIDRGLDMLEALAADHAAAPLERLCDVLLEAMVEQPPADDVCLLAVRRPIGQEPGAGGGGPIVGP